MPQQPTGSTGLVIVPIWWLQMSQRENRSKDSPAFRLRHKLLLEKCICGPVWVSSGHRPHPHLYSDSHTQAGTKRPTSVWPYQCHRFVPQSFRVHEVSLATMRSIAQPTVQRLAAPAATQSCRTEEIKLIRVHTLSDPYLDLLVRAQLWGRTFPSRCSAAVFAVWKMEYFTWGAISMWHISIELETSPRTSESFLFTLLSHIFPDSDLSQPIGTLARTGQSHWFPIPSWHNKERWTTVSLTKV